MASALDREVMAEAALAYAGRGWPIFPINYVRTDLKHGACAGTGAIESQPCKGCSGTGFGCSCTRGDCDRIGKHPVNFLAPSGFQSSTTELDKVAGWWKRWPWNIGLWCRGFLVVDVEKQALADNSFYGWVDSREWPETLVARTGGQGLHFYFRVPDGVHVAQRNGLIPKVDTRTVDGYVLLPPSNHLLGRYDWSNPTWETETAYAPDWLIQECAKAAPESVVTNSTPIPDGTRNVSLFKIACAMRGYHGQYGVYLSNPAVIMAAIREINTLYVDPPKPEAELVKLVTSACEKKTAAQVIANSRANIDALYRQ